MAKIELRLIGDDDKVLVTKTIEIDDEDLTIEAIYHRGYWSMEASSAVEFELLRRGRDLMRDALLILRGINRPGVTE